LSSTESERHPPDPTPPQVPDQPPQTDGAKASAPTARWLTVLLFSGLVAVLWVFPNFWYTRAGRSQDFRWLAENTNVPGHFYRSVPVNEVAEAFLVADRLSNGEFSRTGGLPVRVFSAKRYLKKENEIGLFSHTPDRCWTSAGWKMEPLERDYCEVEVHGMRILFERRLFTAGVQRELVYFGALVGGKPLPYRLNQYAAAAQGREGLFAADRTGTLRRLAQSRMWGWAMESFFTRTPLLGPQRFIRLSSSVDTAGLGAADQRLQELIPQWLQPVDYDAELAHWPKSH